jgi:very-short-patch-repair endonuclease
MSRDAERMNALNADGYRVYQFTYEHVTLRSEQMVEVTRRALRRG